jgi:hypothetical protein
MPPCRPLNCHVGECPPPWQKGQSMNEAMVTRRSAITTDTLTDRAILTGRRGTAGPFCYPPMSKPS